MRVRVSLFSVWSGYACAKVDDEREISDESQTGLIWLVVSPGKVQEVAYYTRNNPG